MGLPNFLQCLRWHSPTLCVRYCPWLNMPTVCSHIGYDIVAALPPNLARTAFAYESIHLQGQPLRALADRLSWPASRSLGRTEASSVLRTVACQINQCVNTSFCAVSFLWFSMIFRLLSGRRTPASCALPAPLLFPLLLCSCRVADQFWGHVYPFG